MLAIHCDDNTLNSILVIVQNILKIIQIVVPILLLVFATIQFIKLVKNPEEKSGVKKIIHSFIAAVIVFFIPMLVNVVMGMLGDGNDISKCWNANVEIGNPSYIEMDSEKNRKKFIPNASDYEKGLGELDFSCTSNIVKAHFSCETLKIVEKHLYDFDATTFNSVINNKYGGDFGQYAKSVGGIFGEYYGKKIDGRTESDFQRVAEYVLGWMYMYGWNYSNSHSGGGHVRWRGDNDFYAHGGFVGQYISDSGGAPEYRGLGTNFDNVISTKSQGGSVGRMASSCGDLEVFVYNKLNIDRQKFKVLRRLRELKVGDCIYFYEGERKHNAIIGEVYDDHLVIYDGGSYYPIHQDYKREVYFPTENTKAADDATIKKTIGYSGWVVRRWYNFEKDQ